MRLFRQLLVVPILAVALQAATPATQDGLACRTDNVLDPVQGTEGWTERSFSGQRAFNVVQDADGDALQVRPHDGSPAGLGKSVVISLRETPVLEFTWKVTQLAQAGGEGAHEAFAAAVLLHFGEPTLAQPQVPTLAYVWSSAVLSDDARAAISSGNKAVAYIRLEGADAVGHWRTERRDVAADYKAAFGKAVKAPLREVVIFADSDTRREPAVAYYRGLAFASCTAAMQARSTPPSVSR